MNDNYEVQGKLKSLFFKQEIERFNQLEEEIEKLHLVLDDTESIVSKIKPLLHEILLERLADKDAKIIEIYANQLATIIERSIEKNLPNLSKSLQPIISPAIGREIEENKDKMIDTLYPIMGSMIAKYVTNAIEEMMEKINTKVESGLSLNTYKRKVKSKISGVSESELLLQESHHAMIGSLFIIEKESALLIAEEHIENQAISDPHMVASMASAIKDFVDDWISTHQESDQVQLLSYGNATLYIESAGSIYLIAFLHKEPDYEQRREIQEFFAGLVKKYGSFFQDFDGDDSSEEIAGIKLEMHEFLVQHAPTKPSTKKQTKSNIPKYILAIGAFGLVMMLGMQVKEYYHNATLESMIRTQTGYDIKIDTIEDRVVLSGDVNDSKTYFQIQKLLEDKGYDNLLNHIYVPPVDSKLEQNADTMKIHYLEQKLKDLEIQLKKMQ